MTDSQTASTLPKKGAHPFDAPIDLETLAAQQGVSPVAFPEILQGDFWPEDENTEDFLQALRAWRHEDSKREVC